MFTLIRDRGRVCKSNESESVCFRVLLWVSFPSQMGWMHSFSWWMCSFSGRMRSFSGRMRSFLLQDCFDLEIMHFVAAGLLSP